MLFIENRKKVYKDLNNFNDSSYPGLVYFYDAKFDNLKRSVRNYLKNSLESYYQRKFNIGDDLKLHECVNDILSLPNITPNGNLLPKKETAESLTIVQKDSIDLLDSLGILDNIDRLCCVTVMIKTPTDDNKILNRSYYTGKIHSEAWSGHHPPYGDALFMAGILGDIRGNTVEYFEPIKPKENFLDIVNDYNDAHQRYSNIKHIGEMLPSKLIIMDHCCLHRTKFKKDSKTRVSISFGVIMKSSFTHERNTEIIDRWKETYFQSNILKRVGNDTGFYVEETFSECIRKFKDNVSAKPLPNNGIYLKEKTVENV